MDPRTLALLAIVATAPLTSAAPAACTAGSASGHACERIDFVGRLDVTQLGYGPLNDVWGWTDPVGGREYALVGATVGTVFVDITDPANPRIVGRLPAHENISPAGSGKIGGTPPSGPIEMCKASGGTSGPAPAHEGGCGSNSAWRNIKVYADHAFVGSESGGHGLQVFDLTQLRAFPPGSPVQRFGETAHYGGFGHSHTLWIDAANAMLYAVGSDTYGGGPHFVDISDPAVPVGVGGYAGDGYTHEILCQVYAGPDVAHLGAQICIASNEDTLTVLDVTNKAAPVQLARVSYSGVGFTHQGWLTADQRYMFVNDELDELDSGQRTRTLVWDFADLEAPVLIDQIRQPRYVIDHNLYLHQGFMFQSDYTAGLVVYDARDPLHAFEVGYFDTHPSTDAAQFDGTWSNYPFFASGIVAVSDISRGLYLLQPQLGGAAEDARIVATPGFNGNTEFEFTLPSAGYVSFSVGPEATMAGLLVTPANATAGCTMHAHVIQCRFDGVLGLVQAQVEATTVTGVSTFAVAMVSGQGDETAPVDNRVSATIPTTVGSPSSGGGGGAFAPGLILLLGAAALRRRWRNS